MRTKRYLDFIVAGLVAGIGYWLLLSTPQTGLVDTSIEMILFFSGSLIAFIGFFKLKGASIAFRRFELFYGLTYSIAVLSFIIGIVYYINNPLLSEISLEHVKGNPWLIVMSSIKSLSLIFLILTWINFYKNLNIHLSKGKKIGIYLIGVLIYLGTSVLIWQVTNDSNVLSLGLTIGLVVGIFGLIAQDRRTRYLTFIFIDYSAIHLIDSYHMGLGYDLTASITNPIYWGISVLYILEVRRWIKTENYR